MRTNTRTPRCRLRPATAVSGSGADMYSVRRAHAALSPSAMGPSLPLHRQSSSHQSIPQYSTSNVSALVADYEAHCSATGAMPRTLCAKRKVGSEDDLISMQCRGKVARLSSDQSSEHSSQYLPVSQVSPRRLRCVNCGDSYDVCRPESWHSCTYHPGEPELGSRLTSSCSPGSQDSIEGYWSCCRGVLSSKGCLTARHREVDLSTLSVAGTSDVYNRLGITLYARTKPGSFDIINEGFEPDVGASMVEVCG